MKFLSILTPETVCHKHVLRVRQSLNADCKSTWINNCHDLGDSILRCSPKGGLSKQCFLIVVFGETHSQDTTDSGVVLNLEEENEGSLSLRFQVQISNIYHGSRC